ncbi:hypothetical protein R3W88_004241 [Solanum pinnatisectum]|uniref:Myb/SANT-like domain-containing protein n=1 Tax=Solanum pinnatisectum TaxID=50273 RepID=A0AAV9K966_9SOLN|nr:hypothetical protein R3W88_004241 [Solanum pinnatisectum]
MGQLAYFTGRRVARLEDFKKKKKRPALSNNGKLGSNSCDEDELVATSSKNDHNYDSSTDDSVSKKEESSSSEDDDSTSSADDAASKMEESSGDGSSSDDDDDSKPTKVNKTSCQEEPIILILILILMDTRFDCFILSGKAVVLSKTKVDSCDDQQEFLITILYVELVMQEKDVNQLDWAGIVQKLYHQTRKQISVTQVQALYKKFRDQTNQFMDLLKVVGYEWNQNNNNVTCKDEVWEDIYWIHGGDKLFRKKGLLHYNLLSYIFGSGNKHFVQESHVHVQRIAQTTSFTSTRLWRWLFG